MLNMVQRSPPGYVELMIQGSAREPCGIIIAVVQGPYKEKDE